MLRATPISFPIVAGALFKVTSEQALDTSVYVAYILSTRFYCHPLIDP